MTYAVFPLTQTDTSSQGACIFAAGQPTLSTYTAQAYKYPMGNNTFIPTATLSLARAAIAGAGNATRGIFAGGYDGTSLDATSDKYTYGSDTRSTATALGTAVYAPGACGTATVGIFGGGQSALSGGSQTTTNTNKYTYSTDVVTSGTALGTARSYVSGVGNATVGIFGGGCTVPTSNATWVANTDKYTYSGDTVASGTALSNAEGFTGTAGTSTVGIFGGGRNGTADASFYIKYTYSGDTVATTVTISLSRNSIAGAGNSSYGIFAGGTTIIGNTVSNRVDKYRFSNDTSTAASVATLNSVTCRQGGLSTVPGGF